MSDILLKTVNLTKSFRVRKGFFGQKRLRLVAVDNVNIEVKRGETLGMVGESGCGKTTLGLTIMNLYEPTSGQVIVNDQEITRMSGTEMHQARRQMQMIFQDPFASLDPRMTVEEILTEPMEIHEMGSRLDRKNEAVRLVNLVGLPRGTLQRYPNEFSGGQQQRIGIARALALQPKLIICDEPVSALDVSVQAQILNLLRSLQEQFQLTYLFISHNMAVTSFMSQRIGVMYLGKLVEIAPSQSIIDNARHPYTQALVAAVPEPDPDIKRKKRGISGDIPSPIDRPSGCPFHPRCPIAQAICSVDVPELREIVPDHFAACHFA
ncbi:MAG: ABC transporter ATP-binding protein [Omnitrophica WOR_2 bacterium]